MEASAPLFRSSSVSRETFSPPPPIGISPCHSPAPDIFAGLGVGMAVTLGLIAFVFIIHACCWRLCRQVGCAEEACRSGPTLNVHGGEDTPPFEEILVIMAGDTKPTFLATPASTTNF
ncbi:hypothetical protein SASPL_153768 [Salvia splendens]|uniref:Uncharacterized protein n=1 Tax=Salvia splendens TaxID=180675 RepID=A0A8X8VYX3_SALSN|nr:hypothetical protein SASPL_153768 [Salvia splendens]